MELRNLLPIIKRLHETIRETVVDACERTEIGRLSAVSREDEGDTIYAVDEISEELVVKFIEREIAAFEPVVLIAEGIENGSIVLPKGANESDAKWRIIVDPIDGTRGLMFQKRSAWILTGVAPNKDEDTSLADVEFAIQTEIPLVKQHLSDMLWAFRGEGTNCERFNRLTGESSKIKLEPSRADSIAHGFASISRFIPGVGTQPGEIYEAVVKATLGEVKPGKAGCFEDQYISTGGQLYELMAGHDRFVADLRPMFENTSSPLGLCCHPYDLCTELIAREMGVIITDGHGDDLDAPLAVEPDVAWIGYANSAIRDQVESHLLREIAARVSQ